MKQRTISFERLDAMLNPKTRKVLRSRLLDIDWLVGPRWDPWIDVRLYRLAGLSLYVEVGRLWLSIPGHPR